MGNYLFQLIGAVILLVMFSILMVISPFARAILKRSLKKPFVSERYSHSSAIKWTPLHKAKPRKP